MIKKNLQLVSVRVRSDPISQFCVTRRAKLLRKCLAPSSSIKERKEKWQGCQNKILHKSKLFWYISIFVLLEVWNKSLIRNFLTLSALRPVKSDYRQQITITLHVHRAFVLSICSTEVELFTYLHKYKFTEPGFWVICGILMAPPLLHLQKAFV